MLKIGILDDEQHYTEKLAKNIYNYFINNEIDIEIFQTTKANELVDYVTNNTKLDYIFLDYDMPDMNGYELGKILRKYDENFKLIYVTSYEDKVFKCIENNVYRYIRKFKLNDELEACLESIVETQKDNDLLSFSTSQGDTTIKQEHILFIESSNRSIYLGHTTGVYVIKKVTLKEIFEKLNPKHFVYINKGTIVNLANIENIRKDELILTNQQKFLISRRKRLEVNQTFLEYKVKW